MPLAHPADSMKKYCPTHWPVNMNYAFIVKIQWEENEFKYRVRVMVFNPTFNNISVIYIIVAVSFIDEGNQSTQWKPPTCLKSLTNFIT